MTEYRAFETSVKNFLLGLSVGVLLATILNPRDYTRQAERRRNSLGKAWEGSFHGVEPTT